MYILRSSTQLSQCNYRKREGWKEQKIDYTDGFLNVETRIVLHLRSCIRSEKGFLLPDSLSNLHLRSTYNCYAWSTFIEGILQIRSYGYHCYSRGWISQHLRGIFPEGDLFSTREIGSWNLKRMTKRISCQKTIMSCFFKLSPSKG